MRRTRKKLSNWSEKVRWMIDHLELAERFMKARYTDDPVFRSIHREIVSMMKRDKLLSPSTYPFDVSIESIARFVTENVVQKNQ